MSDDEGEEREDEGEHEPEESLVRPRHALEELSVEERLLCGGERVTIGLSSIGTEFGEAGEGRESHRGEGEGDPGRLALPVQLVVAPLVICASSQSIEIECVESESNGEGEGPEDKVRYGSSERGGPPVEAV